ncbi:MAG: RNA polymerase sigma factor [Phycisphaerales bacterium JB054]
MQNATSNELHRQPHNLSQYALDRIEYRVARLAQVFRLSADDADDLRQDMALEVWRAMPRFDAEKASEETFINRVLDLYYRHTARSIRTQRRHEAMSPALLSAMNGWVPLTNDTRAGEQSEADRACEAVDIERALATLPRKLRLICEELKHHTPRDVAQRLRMHRGSVYRAIGQIRAHLEACGIRAAA